jgi:uncharacterized protein
MRIGSIVLLCTAALVAHAAEPRQPVIDVHVHAAWPGEDDAAARNAMLQEMDSAGIVLALLHINEPADVASWLEAAPGRFVGGPAMPCPPTPNAPYFRCFAETAGWPDLAWLERELAAGRIGLLGEMLFVYTGVHPDDAKVAPYWALAAKYDVPVIVHSNRGPAPGVGPRRDPKCCPDFDGELGNPALLRSVLQRHPKLRLILAHVGTGSAPDHLPFDAETFALLSDFPSVYVDLSILNSVAPAQAHAAVLKRLVDAGFGDRILFGSDKQPAALILRRLAEIDWLTPELRRSILYDNAARFLRLDARTIARHHAEAKQGTVDKRGHP